MKNPVILMCKTLSVVFAILGFALPVLTWTGTIPSLYVLLDTGGMTGDGLFVRFFLAFFGGAAWLPVCATGAYLCEILARRIDLGSTKFWAMIREERKNSQEKKKSIGFAQRVSVEPGGFLGSDISTIETESGFYRVFGDVGTVKKGVEVWLLGKQWLLIDGKKEKFILK